MTEEYMVKASSHRSMPVILGRWAGDGSGIVRPSFPTWSFKLEFTRSRKREEKGRRVARSTYSPFVMAAIWLLERWLATDGSL